MVANIEKSKKSVDSISVRAKKSKDEIMSIPDIIKNLLSFQLCLRSNLKEIDWPPMIIASTTQTGITHANVTVDV